MLAELQWRAAREVESALGPKAALAAYWRLCRSLPSGRYRLWATYAGLRCALTLDDTRKVVALLEALDQCGPHLTDESLEMSREVLLQMRSKGYLAEAIDFCDAELRRVPHPRHLYRQGRFLDLVGDPRAIDAYRALIGHSDTSSKTGHSETGHPETRHPETGHPETSHAETSATSLRRRAALLLLAHGERVEDETLIPAPLAAETRSLPPALRLVVASHALSATSRYKRVAGLDLILEVARSMQPKFETYDASATAHGPLHARALLFALQHVDHRIAEDLGLSRIEEDRVRAIIKTAAPSWSNRLLQHLETRFDAPPPKLPPWAEAMTAGENVDLSSLGTKALDRLHTRERRDAEAWTVAALCLRDPDEDTQRIGADLLAYLIALPGPLPPRGYLGLYAALRAPEEHPLAPSLLAQAIECGEPTADSLWVQYQSRQAWNALSRGDDDRALALLRSASNHQVR